jgi:hypothetical protein|tara:strand:- start:414 stop:542 length:129 start_codon:yes stop_codon:yes gene_type:complete
VVEEVELVEPLQVELVMVGQEDLEVVVMVVGEQMVDLVIIHL